VRNTFVSEIGQPLFAGVDLDSHLERFVLDAVDGELPESTGPVTPPPARAQTPRPPPLKLRAPSPPRVAPHSLLPDLEASAPTQGQLAPETKPTPQATGGVPESSAPASVEPVVAQEAGPFGGGDIPSTADLNAIIEKSLREEPEPPAPRSSEASGMTVDALPVGAAQVTHQRSTHIDGRELLDRLRAQLQRVPRSAWEAAAAALLGGVIGYQASSLLMWLVG